VGFNIILVSDSILPNHPRFGSINNIIQNENISKWCNHMFMWYANVSVIGQFKFEVIKGCLG
jgi:hypothetical protein